jgi:hypothetical protein
MSSFSSSSVLPLQSLFLLFLLPVVISGFVVSTCHQYPQSQLQQHLQSQLGLQARIAVAKSLRHDMEGKTPQLQEQEQELQEVLTVKVSRKKSRLFDHPVSRCDTQIQVQGDNEWNESYEQLKAFYNRHEHVRLHQTTKHKNLHEWCQVQAQLASNGRLTHVHLSKLVEIGFWNNELHSQPWDHWYRHLMAFYLQHGHSNVQCTSKTYLLAQWLQLQRTSAFLSIRQKRLLWSINFVFDAEQAEFETQYQRLLELETKQPILSVRQWKKIQRGKSKENNAMSAASSTTTSDAFVADTLWKLGAAHDELQQHERSGHLGLHWTESSTNRNH